MLPVHNDLKILEGFLNEDRYSEGFKKKISGGWVGGYSL